MPKVISLETRRGAARDAPLAERSDDELMLLVRAGMHAALAALATRHTGRLSRFCAKQLGDAGAAEDVTQETWIRLWASRTSYRPEGKLLVLLYTTARNLCRNQARGVQRREHWLPSTSSPVELERVLDERPDHVGALIAIECQRAVNQALGELPEPMREALLLRFGEGLAYEDIAAIVGASESTVRSRVFHGLKRLSGHLTDWRES